MLFSLSKILNRIGLLANPEPQKSTEPMARKINQAGTDLIKTFEGCILTAYLDAVGIRTIGYGHVILKDETFPQKMTQAQCDELLLRDLAKFEVGVLKFVDVAISDNEFAALVAFSFNVGLANLGASTLLKKLNENDKIGASSEFLKWVKAGGRELPGLVKRRAAERELFLKK